MPCKGLDQFFSSQTHNTFILYILYYTPTSCLSKLGLGNLAVSRPLIGQWSLVQGLHWLNGIIQTAQLQTSRIVCNEFAILINSAAIKNV